MIDIKRQLRIEVPQRIVGQCRQVHHGVDAFEVGRLNIAQVFHNLRNRNRFRSKGAGAIQVCIQSNDLVARFQKHRDQNRPDITTVSRYQYSH